MSRPDQCFACGRALHEGMERLVDTRDAQTVYVGPECYKKIAEAEERGYQPPRGGPRLYLYASYSGIDKVSVLVDDKQAREKTPRTDAKIKLFSVTYWLLEHKHYDPRRYWATEKRVGWVTNPLEANRYRSKEDADLTGKVLDDDCSSFEHMDCQVEFVHAEFARQLEREIESLCNLDGLLRLAL